jgi:hypothetical protein
MKTKATIYIIGLILIAVPFKMAYVTPSESFFVNLFSFLSVLVGFLLILIGGSSSSDQLSH